MRAVEMSTTEKEKTDRLRERRKKKSAQRIRHKEKERIEKAVDKANPGLGNKHAKNNALRKLEQAEKEGAVTLVIISLFHLDSNLLYQCLVLADQRQQKQICKIVHGVLRPTARKRHRRTEKRQNGQTEIKAQRQTCLGIQIEIVTCVSSEYSCGFLYFKLLILFHF